MADTLSVTETVIPGLFEIDLVVNGDNRGYFKENYQQAKLEALGLPHFEVKQNNISFNKDKGVIRGLHAEPWQKYISVGNGKAFGTWVDLRKGSNFGKKLSAVITPDKAFFVPIGVANGFQSLEENTVYSYLVTDFWRPGTKYVSVNVYDPDLAVEWPIGKDQAELSEKDSQNPMLSEVSPMEL
jgi:dTDP-4-dehydrorhamnose 3,5-epimerase